MNIDVSQIIADKLAQLEADGTIKRKIEESLEKSIMSAISSELESYSFRNGIEKQLRETVSTLAEDCGLSAYNGYIAARCKDIVQKLFTTDMSEKVQKALDDIMFTKHENIKLSDIFKRYREWVLEHTDESDKYERQEFTHELDVQKDGLWTRYTCKFADHTLEDYTFSKEKPEIEVHLSTYGSNRETSKITTLYLDGRHMNESFKVGYLTDFEAFILNLYYNGTEIILDAEAVEEEPWFDIDI